MQIRPLIFGIVWRGLRSKNGFRLEYPMTYLMVLPILVRCCRWSFALLLLDGHAIPWCLRLCGKNVGAQMVFRGDFVDFEK